MSSFFTQPKAIMNTDCGPFPAHYGSASEEYAALQGAGGFLEDTATQCISVSGPDAATFLMGLLTLDINALAIGGCQSTFALDASGKVMVFLKVYRPEKDSFYLTCPPRHAVVLKEHLARYVIMEQVSVALLPSLHTVIFIGDAGSDAVKKLQDQNTEGIFANARAGLATHELLIVQDNRATWQNRLEALNLQPIGWTAYDQARIEAFEPHFPRDILPETNPVIYGVPDAISATKGCYIGQETVAMTRDRGRPPYLLAQLRKSGNNQDFSKSQTFFRDAKNIGHSHSMVFSTKYNAQIAIAALKFKLLADGVSEIEDQDGHTWHIERFNDSHLS